MVTLWDDGDEAPLFTQHCERPVEAVLYFKNWLYFEPGTQDRSSIYDWIRVARMASDIKERGIDRLSPIWNILDLTPQGRGDWYAKLEYAKQTQTSHG
jgi:hypothetical protein